MIHEYSKGGFHRPEKFYEMGLLPSTRKIMERTGVKSWEPQKTEIAPLKIVR